MKSFVLSCVFGSILLLGCDVYGGSRPTQVEIWNYIQVQSASVYLDPEFVYAIAMAESSLNPDADSASARGIMQLTKPAWEAVTSLPYSFAWDWRMNIRMGVLYLAMCRDFLMDNQAYSLERLAACYRYGMQKVKDANFDVLYLPTPQNKIYFALLREGKIPVSPPFELYHERQHFYYQGEGTSAPLGSRML